MQKTINKWDPSKLLVMEKWKNQNDATAKETAAHFKVDTKGYVLARQRHLIGKGLIQKHVNKKDIPTKSEVIDLGSVNSNQSGAIALILIRPDQLSTILGDLWQ